MFDAVTTVIPGAKNAQQAADNVAAASLAPLGAGQMQAIAGIYDSYIRQHVHQRW